MGGSEFSEIIGDLLFIGREIQTDWNIEPPVYIILDSMDFSANSTLSQKVAFLLETKCSVPCCFYFFDNCTVGKLE